MPLAQFLSVWKCPQGCASATAIDRGDVMVVRVCPCFWHLWPSVLGPIVVEADKPVILETRQ